MSRRRNKSSSAGCCGVGCVFFFLFAFIGSLSSHHDSSATPPAVVAPAPAYMETPTVSTPITPPGSDSTSAAADKMSQDATYQSQAPVIDYTPPPANNYSFPYDANSGYTQPAYTNQDNGTGYYNGGTYVQGYYRHNRSGGTSYVRSHHRR